VAWAAGRIGWLDRRDFSTSRERLAGLSKKGDDLERLAAAVIDFEVFRPELERAVPRADRSKGGRPPFDHVLMFKAMILQTQNNLSDERTEFYLRDRLTWMRFLDLGLADAVPDANTIWTFREALTKAGAIERLFAQFDRELRAQGYLAMSGQLVDASLVAAPKQRNTRAEKQALKEGRVPDEWQRQPAKLRQKDRDARWTVKTTKAKPREGESPMIDLAIPEYGYQNHISADRRHRLIRRWLVTDAAAHAGTRLCDLLDPDNTASGVWADTGYRSKKNEDLLRRRMLVSHIHRKKPVGRPMPERTARANARRSAARAHIEHVFAEQKARIGLFGRTIGLARATTKIGLANLVYNMRRLLWLAHQPALT
jgi:IS5 family transposase